MFELPDSPELTQPVKVYFFDTDAGGVVHNVAYLRMIEAVRSDLAEHLGWQLGDMVSEKSDCPVVYRTEIDYLKPARLGDDLVIEAKLVKIERVRMTFEFRMLRRPEDEVLVKCRQVLVPMDLVSGRPRPMPPQWAEKWPELVGSR
ncbi:MAG: thioesterase family protein [Verrucomicrobiota bacterium]